MTRSEARQRLETPAELGYALPAEWEPHAATWLIWPHNPSDWPGKMAAVQWAFVEMAVRIARHEKVRVVVQSAPHAQRVRRMLAGAGLTGGALELHIFPTDRSWARDYGPVFLTRRDGVPGDAPGGAIVRFRFTGWGRYPAHKLDAALAGTVCGELGMTLFSAGSGEGGFVLEGGAVDVNGSGTVIATEQCMLDQETQPRNRGLGRGDVERVFADYLGAPNTIWLGAGIGGDDTHGHIDDVCRFVGPRTIAAVREDDPSDPNYAPLMENLERLAGARLEDGTRPEVVELPMPRPLHFRGERLPASYANFYICNAAVLVPTFNDPSDRRALGILAELMPDREVAGIHAVDLVWGLGTVHCVTREQPG